MFKYQGIEKLVCPLLPRMISQLSTVNAAVIDSLVAHNETSPIVLEHLATLVLRLLLDTPEHGEEDVDSEHAKVIQLLSSIQQRHPSVVQAAMSAITSNDPTHQSTIDKVILSLAISGSSSVTFAGGASAQMDVVLASKHADPAVRAIAIRDIHKALATWGNVEADEVITLRAALKARIEDPAPAVLVALYAEPRILLSVLQEDPVAYITAVAAAIYPESGSSSASRAIVRSHVDFLSFTFLPAFTGDDPAAVGVVRLAFEKIYFPSLLLSNPRHKTARTVWSAITDVRAEQGTNAMELVQGCVETYLWGMQEAGVDTNPTKKGQSEGKVNQKDPQERAMAKVNIAISARMGELIAMSESRAAYTDFLLSTLKSTNSHARLLAALVLRSFLGNVSGSLQIMAAHRILDVVGSESIATMSGFMGGADNLQAFLSDDALGLATVLKPNSSNTRDKLHASLLVLIPLIPRPRGITLDWIAQGSSSLNDTPGPQFVGLLQRLYGIANASALLPLLSTNLLRALFISLGPDTLLFLTGISSITAPTSALGSKEERIAHAALSHAVAFFAAHQGASGPTDFQTVVPSLIVDLQTESRIVREAALECLALVNRLVQTGKPESVYAMDDVYGHHSCKSMTPCDEKGLLMVSHIAKIQFIDWVDLGKYLTALLLQHDHLVGSAAYLAHFHGEHLTRQKGDGKKEGTYKQRTLCYLLSHVQAVPLLPLRASLVKSLAEVSSAVKLDMLHDLLDDVLKMERKVLEDTYGSDTEAFVIALVKMFGGTSGSAIRDPSGKEWVLFKKTISRCLRPGVCLQFPLTMSGHKADYSNQISFLPQSIILCMLFSVVYIRVLHRSSRSNCANLPWDWRRKVRTS
jgi:U3 small nucleolar RNA-associated protein 10